MELLHPTPTARVTVDHDLQPIEGNYDKFVGKVQERYGDQKDELMTWADQWHRKSAPDAIKKEKAG